MSFLFLSVHLCPQQQQQFLQERVIFFAERVIVLQPKSPTMGLYLEKHFFPSWSPGNFCYTVCSLKISLLSALFAFCSFQLRQSKHSGRRWGGGEVRISLYSKDKRWCHTAVRTWWSCCGCIGVSVGPLVWVCVCVVAGTNPNWLPAPDVFCRMAGSGLVIAILRTPRRVLGRKDQFEPYCVDWSVNWRVVLGRRGY